MQIRATTIEELKKRPVLVARLYQLTQPHDSGLQEYLDDELRPDEERAPWERYRNVFVFLAESAADGDVVGWLMARGAFRFRVDGGLFVDSARRREGLGRALVAAALGTFGHHYVDDVPFFHRWPHDTRREDLIRITPHGRPT